MCEYYNEKLHNLNMIFVRSFEIEIALELNSRKSSRPCSLYREYLKIIRFKIKRYQQGARIHTLHAPLFKDLSSYRNNDLIATMAKTVLHLMFAMF